MKIQVNGKPLELAEPHTIPNLLNQLELSGKPVVIEHNQTALFPRDYETTTLTNGDTLEIITIAAGG